MTPYIDPSVLGGKEHIGYIVDRTGFDKYKSRALRGVTLPLEAEINERIYWSGIRY